MNVIGMMRIQNEARWIERILDSMRPVCERIFILDDHSTDETRDICRAFPEVTLYESPFNGCREDRDKNWLLEKIEAHVESGSWLLSIDGDEEVAPGGCDEIRYLAEHGRADSYRFQVLYLWDRPDQIRVDRLYSNFRRPSFFRLKHGQRFRSSTGGGFHCGNVPIPGDCAECSVKLLHYGYIDREQRIRKWHFYNSHDPQNRSEGYDPRFPERRTYPHIVQGDIPEVPADAVLVHAGPLELRPLGLI